MNLSFRKLLPQKMRNTRWGELLDVVQDLWVQLKREKVSPIFNQFDISKATREEKIEIAKTFGFHLLTFDGYTETDYFLNKEIQTIVPRIKYKNAIPSYTYTGYVFDLLTNLYAISATNTGWLTTSKLSTIYSPETQITYATTELDQEGDNLLYFVDLLPWDLDCEGSYDFELDSGNDMLTLDTQFEFYDDPKETGKDATTLDSEDFISLDPATGEETGGGESVVTQITRNLNFNYKHKFVENENEFMSLNTLKVLKNDIDQIHKVTEVIYYTPKLEIDVKKDLTPVTQTYSNYNVSLTANQYNLLMGEGIENLLYLEFGTGTQSISGTITGVNNFAYRYPDYISGVIPASGIINYFDATNNSGVIAFDFNIDERNRFTEFTEVAMYNKQSGLVLYSTFPKVQWDENMYNNVQFEIKYV